MLTILHDGLATAALLYMLVLGLWGLAGSLRGTGISPGYRGSLIIGEGLLLVELLLGVVLWLVGQRPVQTIHLLYGILAPLMLPFAAGLLRGRGGRIAPLLYGLTALFVVGLILRAMATDR